MRRDVAVEMVLSNLVKGMYIHTQLAQSFSTIVTHRRALSLAAITFSVLPRKVYVMRGKIGGGKEQRDCIC
jgi:hypothetical protein